MLAQSGAGDPPATGDWLHEIKWDGVRAVLAWDGTAVAMRSRAGNDMVDTYPELAAAALTLEPNLILDGEIVTLDENGVPSFELLQRRMNLHAPSLVADAVDAVPVTYVVFDILHRGVSQLDSGLEDRQAALAGVEMPTGFVTSDTYAEPAPLWSFAREKGLEGVLSKRRGSLYRPGIRSADWVKHVAFRSLRAVVGGFTAGEGGRRNGFGALILGLWAGDRLRWIGSVGSGFSHADVANIRTALDEMTTAESPFEPNPDMPGSITWVTPALVAVVQFKQWTGAQRLRGPSFKGFSDEPLEQATWEAEGPYAAGG